MKSFVMNKSLFQRQKKFLKKKKFQQLKEENEQLTKENEHLNNVTKDAKIKESIKKPKEIKSPNEDKNLTDYPNWFDKNKLKIYQLLLTATNLITKIKQVNASILTLKTWLIILETIQLVKYLLKKV